MRSRHGGAAIPRSAPQAFANFVDFHAPARAWTTSQTMSPMSASIASPLMMKSSVRHGCFPASVLESSVGLPTEC
jgi:hypothetical protein